MIKTKDLIELMGRLSCKVDEDKERCGEIVARLEELDELRGQMKAVKDCLQNRASK